ncbi:MAG: carbohydrate binding domain-containing protein [Planctomycetes bacterium]|nr:carbohydrate binding domain-containing protein [Planctomycetota bacterium]
MLIPRVPLVTDLREAAAALLLAAAAAAPAAEEPPNLVANGSFEALRAGSTEPEAWSAAGNAAVKQELALDAGRDGKRCARLRCTTFAGDAPDSHAMICQVGRVSVSAGKWYRLSFWARGEGIRHRAVDVALSDTRKWENAGLAETFQAGPRWDRVELVFRAVRDLAAADGRLQFWFRSTGSLWLDDVTLAETSATEERLPQVATEGFDNFVPIRRRRARPRGVGAQGRRGLVAGLVGQVERGRAGEGQARLRRPRRAGPPGPGARGRGRRPPAVPLGALVVDGPGQGGRGGPGRLAALHRRPRCAAGGRVVRAVRVERVERRGVSCSAHGATAPTAPASASRASGSPHRRRGRSRSSSPT